MIAIYYDLISSGLNSIQIHIGDLDTIADNLYREHGDDLERVFYEETGEGFTSLYDRSSTYFLASELSDDDEFDDPQSV